MLAIRVAEVAKAEMLTKYERSFLEQTSGPFSFLAFFFWDPARL